MMSRVSGTTGTCKIKLYTQRGARCVMAHLLALALLSGLVPLRGEINAVLALGTADTTPEAVRLVQRGQGSLGLALPSSYQTSPSVSGQGNDHTAWAFAAAVVLEEAARVSLGSPLNFSPNHMRYALSSDSANIYGFPRAYTAAGNRSQVAAYLMRGILGGPVYASLDPYSSGISSGTTEPPRSLADTSRLQPEVRATGVVYIPDLSSNPSQRERELYLTRLKEHIRRYGAAAASLYFDTSMLEGQVYRYTGPNTPDHSVALVGWDDNYAYTSGGASGRGAFRVTDSALDGGRGGMYYVTYDTALTAAYTVRGLTRERFDKTYEYDPFGISSVAGFSSTAYFASVFTAETGSETMEAVTFFATGEETRYEVYLARVSGGDTDAALKAAAGGTPVILEGGVTQGTADLPGYYTIKLDAPWPIGAKGEKFVVLIRAETPYESTPIPLQGASLDATAAAGRCYISGDGSSWVDAYTNNRSSVCVKAHIRTDVDIPLTSVSLKGNDTIRIGGVTYPMLKTAPGQSTMLGPILEPSSAGDVQSVEWFFGDAEATDGSFFSLGVSDKTQSPPPSPSSLPADAERDELDIRTGKLTAHVLGRSSVRCVVTKTDGTSLSAILIVDVSHIEVQEILLELKSAVMKTNQTLTIQKAVTPADTTVKIVWGVARDADYTPYPLEYDAARPYQEGGPIATVDENGKINPIQPGTCYIYAASEDGRVRSEPCELVIEEVPLTGVTLPKKTLELPLGTTYTLVAKAKPADATYQDFSYTSSNGSAVSVDAASGILQTLSVGEAVITAVARNGSTAECTVVVTDKPTRVVRVKDSYTLAATGAYVDKEIKWQFIGALEGNPLSNEHFTTGEPKANKLKLTAGSVGRAVLRAWQEEDYGTDESGQPVVAVVWEQSFALEAVVGTPRLQMSAGGETVKNVTLCIDPNDPSRADSITLTANNKPGNDATLLAFEWKVRNEDVAAIRVDSSQRNRASVALTALKPGTTKLTATNYNGNKRVTVAVRVLYYPTQVNMSGKNNAVVTVGKKLGFRAKVNSGKNMKTIRYVITDAGGNAEPHTRQNPIAEIADNGRLTALRPGRIKVTSYAAPYDNQAARDERVVTVVQPLNKLSFSRQHITLAPGGMTTETVMYTPSDTSQRRVSVISEDESVATVRVVGGRYLIRAVAPGRTRIVIRSIEQPKKQAALTVIVK